MCSTTAKGFIQYENSGRTPYDNLEIRSFGKVRNLEWNDFEHRFISTKPSLTFELLKQELYVRVEAL